jgi:hypothetical protein
LDSYMAKKRQRTQAAQEDLLKVKLTNFSFWPLRKIFKNELVDKLIYRNKMISIQYYIFYIQVRNSVSIRKIKF